jgi:hypothetical protein
MKQKTSKLKKLTAPIIVYREKVARVRRGGCLHMTVDDWTVAFITTGFRFDGAVLSEHTLGRSLATAFDKNMSL